MHTYELLARDTRGMTPDEIANGTHPRLYICIKWGAKWQGHECTRAGLGVVLLL